MTLDYSLKKMNLTYIKAQNYRCYRNLEINFKPGINLLIGDNASGKTTILELGQTVCNTFLSGYHDENTVFRGLKKEAISESAIGETIENAKRQIQEKGYEQNLRERGFTNITKMVYAFKGKEVKMEVY